MEIRLFKPETGNDRAYFVINFDAVALTQREQPVENGARDTEKHPRVPENAMNGFIVHRSLRVLRALRVENTVNSFF
jgi:hypothetical protein